MGYNGPILLSCQDLCVEWWGIGSKLLAWQEKEMSVLASSLFPGFLIVASTKVDGPGAFAPSFIEKTWANIGTLDW